MKILDSLKKSLFEKNNNNTVYKTSVDISKKINDGIRDAFDEKAFSKDDLQKLGEKLRSKVLDEIEKEMPKKIYDSVAEEFLLGYSPSEKYEEKFEPIFYKSRLTMTFAYIFAAFSMIFLVFEILKEILYIGQLVGEHFFLLSTNHDEHKQKLIIGILSILDYLLIGSLVVMVLFSGYENTVSRLKIEEDGPTWLGRIRISDLKIKVASSIVAITSVHLLQTFLQLSHHEQLKFDYNVMWTVIIHVVFIFSALILAYVAKMHPEDIHANTFKTRTLTKEKSDEHA